VLQVDADTVFDPTEIVPGAEERYMHATERVIEKLLEKAKLHSPVFWTHVHRYMPSDSVWCETRSESVQADAGRVRVPEQWHDMVFVHSLCSRLALARCARLHLHLLSHSSLSLVFFDLLCRWYRVI
jgi:hypothetical protein